MATAIPEFEGKCALDAIAHFEPLHRLLRGPRRNRVLNGTEPVVNAEVQQDQLEQHADTQRAENQRHPARQIARLN